MTKLLRTSSARSTSRSSTSSRSSRADGDRHLGGGRRRGDQAVRLHALRARARDGRPLPARRSLLSHLARPRIPHVDGVHRARRQDQPADAVPLRRADRARAQRRREAGQGLARSRCSASATRAGPATFANRRRCGSSRSSPSAARCCRITTRSCPSCRRTAMSSAELRRGAQRRRCGRTRHRPPGHRPRRGRRRAAELFIDLRGVTRRGTADNSRSTRRAAVIGSARRSTRPPLSLEGRLQRRSLRSDPSSLTADRSGHPWSPCRRRHRPVCVRCSIARGGDVWRHVRRSRRPPRGSWRGNAFEQRLPGAAQRSMVDVKDQRMRVSRGTPCSSTEEPNTCGTWSRST